MPTRKELLDGTAVEETKQRSGGDKVIASFNEMREAIRLLYERTGDLQIKPIIERADEAIATLRGMQTR
jgi:hypothetical protein